MGFPMFFHDQSGSPKTVTGRGDRSLLPTCIARRGAAWAAGKRAVPFVEESKEVSKTIYVGNLPFSATDDEIRDLFAAHGDVKSVKLISDRESGRPRGFGFVEMEPSAADAAIEALNGQEYGGRTLRINEARPRAGGGHNRHHRRAF